MANVVEGLTREGCQTRQQKLAAAIAAQKIDAALICSPGHIHWLTGVWTRAVFSHALLLRATGETILAFPEGSCSENFATESIPFPASHFATMVEDPLAAAIHALAPRLQNAKRIAADAVPASALPAILLEDLGPTLRHLRRAKLPDEIALLQSAILATEAAYEKTREILTPGLTEWDLYRQIHAAALQSAGEPIGELGNDFQTGGDGDGGGPARHRPMQSGELLVLDLSVILRGYSSDLCRTFAVDRNPTEPQRTAHQRVVEALDLVEQTVRPGVSCKKLFTDIAAFLHGHRGWTFTHHLGHGIGLNAHETPRLNPHWNDTFQENDLFTAEPGLYAPELKSGIRLEQNYLVTPTGLRRLSHHPLDL